MSKQTKQTKQNITANNINKKTNLTIFSCLIFIISIFIYTVNYRINRVTAMDSVQYHQAVDKYMNTQTYN